MVKRKILDYIAELDRPQFLSQIKDHFMNVGMDEKNIDQAFDELIDRGLIISKTIHGYADITIDVRLLVSKYPDLDYKGILKILEDPDKLAELWAEEEEEEE
ncbi:MAG: hypothetical protein ACFFD4_17710 [Candidatus Odinarchaeota archaeon]